jgi:hypothetical protein
MLMRTIIAILAVLATGAVLAQAYRWVDEDGVVHYSDRPQEGAEQVILPQSTRPTRTVAAAPRPRAGAEEATEEPEGPFSYDVIEVVAPAPEETLWNLEGVLNVSLRIQPGLRQGDQLRVYFDGEMRPATGTSFQISEVYRGVHNIQAEIIDPSGTLMGRSLPNRFYVQQNTIVRAK